nr:hypothetical protein Itr_chr03CG22980 [Ipomoea trifida]
MAAGKEAPPYDHPHVQSSATFLECLLDDLFFLSIKLIPQMSLSLAENEIDLGRPPSDSHLLCKQCFLPPRRLPALSFPVAGILSFFVFFVSPSLLSSPAAALIQLSNIEFPVRQLSSSTLSPPQKSTTAVSDDVTRCIPELLADLSLVVLLCSVTQDKRLLSSYAVVMLSRNDAVSLALHSFGIFWCSPNSSVPL